MVRTTLAKLGFLLLLVAGLISSQPKQAVAAVCCSVCDTRYDACVNACDPHDSKCQLACTVRLNSCERTCIPGC